MPHGSESTSNDHGQFGGPGVLLKVFIISRKFVWSDESRNRNHSVNIITIGTNKHQCMTSVTPSRSDNKTQYISFNFCLTNKTWHDTDIRWRSEKKRSAQEILAVNISRWPQATRNQLVRCGGCCSWSKETMKTGCPISHQGPEDLSANWPIFYIKLKQTIQIHT